MQLQMERSLSVSELNEYVRRLLAGDALLRNVEVTGEISGYKHHYSGHRYFSLKDANARVQCVMFRQSAMGLDFKLEDGMRVTVQASASLFPRDGSYQLYVNAVRKSGIGELYLKFEALKEKLAREGLFDPAIKQEIPVFPRYIGIATSQTGAALRDMIRVARRRNPNVGIILAPCSVQGADAAGDIVKSLCMLNEDGRSDVILCGRGGGSIEDLWAFNEEAVARAIYASKIPVISCVGHETDFTIADFAADVRAATPSMAAEIAVPVLSHLKEDLNTAVQRISSGLNHSFMLRRAELRRISSLRIFHQPGEVLINNHRNELAKLLDRCADSLMNRQVRSRNRLQLTAAKLEALNPSGVLDRGYACISANGRMLSGADELESGMDIRIRMHNGEKDAKVL